MTCPKELRYSKDHEWVKVDGTAATVGITEFAGSELGEIVFVELPEVGKEIAKGEAVCVVESTKAASDVYAPVSGKIVEVNEALSDSPETVNSDAFVSGWMVKLEVSDVSEVESLMNADEYSAMIGQS